MKSFFWLLVLTTVGTCQQNQFKANDLSSWATGTNSLALSQTQKSDNLGDTSSEVCAVDLLQSDRLLAEIKTSEAEFRSGARFVGETWRQQIKLDQIPQPQAIYLQRFDDLFESDLKIPEVCQDLICLLNSIYGPERKDSAYQHYLFFLKTGYGISTHNRLKKNFENVPTDQINKRAFLFPKAGLERLVLLAGMIPAALKNLNSVRYFQFVPPPLRISQIHGPGIIPLNGELGARHLLIEKAVVYEESAISLKTRLDALNQNFFLTVFHELAHGFETAQNGASRIMTAGHPWLRLGGWKRMEVSDPVTKEISSQWSREQDGTAEDVILPEYSPDPSEDFANTVSYFRLRPDLTLQKVPKKSQFVSDLIYDHRRFSVEDWVQEYSKTISQDWNSKASVALTQCQNEKAQNQNQNQCLIEKGLQSFAVSQRKIKIQDVDACRIWSDHGNLLRQKFLSQIETPSSSFYERALVQIAPATVALDCFQEGSSTCYQERVRQYIVEFSKSWPAPVSAGELDQSIDHFISRFPFQNSFQELNRSFERTFAGLEGRVKTEASRIWQSCQKKVLGQDDPFEMPSLSPFWGGENYFRSDFLNCLNQETKIQLPGLVKSYAENYQISLKHATTQGYAVEKASGYLLNSFTDLSRQSANVEAQAKKDAEAKFLDVQKNTEKRKDVCLSEIQGQRSKDPEFRKMVNQFLFVSVEDWALELARKTCL